MKVKTYGKKKKDFAQVSKNLNRYRSKNNFIDLIKITIKDV